MSGRRPMSEPPRRGRAGLGLRPDARAFLDGTRRFAQHITPDPGGSALTSGLGGRPSGFDGSTSAHIWAAHIWALIRIIRARRPLARKPREAAAEAAVRPDRHLATRPPRPAIVEVRAARVRADPRGSGPLRSGPESRRRGQGLPRRHRPVLAGR